MRIRKRKVPLPFSLLSPVPLSDPCLFPVRVHSEPSDHSCSDNSASDLHRWMVGKSDGVIGSEPSMKEKLYCLEFGGGESERVEKSNDGSKGGITTTSAAANNDNNEPVQLLSNEGVIPLKKREHLTTIIVSNEEEEEENGKKIMKGKRGNTIMEGSRCSRVNGRGWRCCQPTLVGYSLCEHHLGKGRLRTVNSVKVSSSSSMEEREREVEKKKKKMMKKKRVKLGVVKARSLTSLLDETNTTTTTTNHDEDL